MTIELNIQQETAVEPGTLDALRAAAFAVLRYERQSSASLTVLLTDDQTLRDLNRQFRSEDRATDVLSFPLEDDGILEGPDSSYLGDIAISVPYAQRQAQAGGHGTTAELQLLLIHGILHLLGHDHENEIQKKTMWAVQRAVLNELGLAHIQPTEE